MAASVDVPVKDGDGKDASQTALDDRAALKTEAREIRDACEDEDFAVANTMEDEVAAYNKEIWFMKSMLK